MSRAELGKVAVLVCSDDTVVEWEVDAGITVAQALESLGYPVKTPCGGMGHCCSCTTKVWRSGEASPTRVRACREVVLGGMRIYPAQPERVSVPVPPLPKTTFSRVRGLTAAARVFARANRSFASWIWRCHAGKAIGAGECSFTQCVARMP